MTQRTITVAHEGAHRPTEDQITDALSESLKADHLKLTDPEYVVEEAVNTSGVDTVLKLTCKTEKLPSHPDVSGTPEKPAADKPKG